MNLTKRLTNFLSLSSLMVLIDLTVGDEIRLSDPYPSGQLVIQDSSLPSKVIENQDQIEKSSPNLLVPVVLGVMSKCPDAQICEDVIDKVLPQVMDMVDLSLSYIGEIDPSSTYGVKCLHGESECKANIQQLCYKKRYPQLKDWWSFVQCQNYAGLNRLGEDILARSCSKLNKHDYDKELKNQCVDNQLGKKLLKASISQSKNLGIVKSCSILINNKLVCVHDGSWVNCPIGHQTNDFVNFIREEFDRINKDLKV